MHTMKRLIVILFVASSVHAQAWSGVLAPARAIDWSSAGIPGGIPSAGWTQCGSTIAAYGTSGSPQSASTINTQISGCGANTYVLLGAGTFYLSDGILIQKSNFELRGSGPQQTKIVFSGHNGCGGFLGNICFRGSSGSYHGGPDDTANWTAGYAQGATQITLSANVTGTTVPYVGATLFLSQTVDGIDRASDNGNVYVCPKNPDCTVAGGGTITSRVQNQNVRITSIVGGSCASGCTVNITPGLYMPNWSGTKSPTAFWSNIADNTNSGVRNLSMDATADAVANGNGNGIQFYNFHNGWVQNCIVGAHVAEPVTQGGTFRSVELVDAHHVTIRDNYFYGRALWDSYGTDFFVAGDSLVENNIFAFVPEPMMNEGSWGNVYTYNFSVNNFWGNPGGTWAMPSAYHHGGFDSHSIYESNIGFGVKNEDYYGQSFFWTNFRNRWFGWQNTSQVNQTVPVMVYSLNRYHNFVGNVLGTATYHTLYEIRATGNTTSNEANCILHIYEIGLGGECSNGNNTDHPFNDTTVIGTLMRWGNYDTVNAANRFVSGENGSGDATYPGLASPNSTLPASFVYSTKPSWWPAAKAWPAIGPEVTVGNVGVCSGGTYDKWPATLAAQCSGGSLASESTGGRTASIPAMDCFFSSGGLPNGSNAGTTTFDANACSVTATSPTSPAKTFFAGEFQKESGNGEVKTKSTERK